VCFGGFRLPARSRFGEGRPNEVRGGATGSKPVGSTSSTPMGSEAPRPSREDGTGTTGLPGDEISFILRPFTPPIPLGRDGALAGQGSSGVWGWRGLFPSRQPFDLL